MKGISCLILQYQYVIKQEQISDVYIHEGPPITMKKHANDFIQKWQHHPRIIKEPYEKNGRLYVEIERKYTDIKKLLTDQTSDLSLGKHMNEKVKKGYGILGIKDLIIDDLKLFWTEYLDNKKTWDR